MQFSQPMGHQQFQGRQLPSGHVQHGIGQGQLNQGSQINRLSQFSSAANSALFNAAQTTANPQMVRFMFHSIVLLSKLLHYLFCLLILLQNVILKLYEILNCLIELDNYPWEGENY
ncbi:hypothetical protein PanWU01x14_298570 [Parasponia andersonii]|uniref:Mediator of RNA polymerase II transcription subunit n=1 Tax=Parasponia andersonii TaxID=3476 RepID=A0A2P5AUX0_PARAD|nr:hypothetical protein PanWU01x14_298570 [Parasponia andersonii]